MRRRSSRVLDINIGVLTVRPSAKPPQVQMLLYLMIMHLMLIGEQEKADAAIRLVGAVPTNWVGEGWEPEIQTSFSRLLTACRGAMLQRIL